MIEETATVIAIENDQLVLQAEQRSACGSCAVKQGCGTSALSGWLGRKQRQLRAANTVDARVGDQVVLGLEEDALLSGSVMIYLLPLLVMILSAVLADQMLDTASTVRELLIILAAAAGFGLMLLLNRFRLIIDKRAGRFSPVVLRKVTPTGHRPFGISASA